ncbi:MAG TPA: ATP-binding cassette domain-containing protein, partial [Ktedonobacteraceae bacterium]|nr:ATP-binding cassette domain-containing protein [Ktedonobacteraceae bacterium]
MMDSVRYLTGPLGKQTRPKIVEFRHLTVMLEKQPVLEDITLDIFEGEFVILVGKPASGKSILLGCVQGLIQPAHGEIVVSGTQLPPLPSELARQIGVLPHYFDDRPAETVLHYLQRFAAYHELQLNEGQLQEYCAHYQLVPSLPIALLTALQERVFALAMTLIHDPR